MILNSGRTKELELVCRTLSKPGFVMQWWYDSVWKHHMKSLSVVLEASLGG